MLITKTKCYTTRSGRAVKVYDFWAGSRLPVIGAYAEKYEWQVMRWTENGNAGAFLQSPLDLIEVPCENELKEKENVFTTTYTCS